jgi:hypothetical protein
MLWSCPTRAHRPIVPGVNLTFDDASSSAASESDIQSDGGFDIGQSGSFAAESVLTCDPAASPDDSAAAAELAPASGDVARPDLPEPDRSLRAQPLPLKWTVGATMAFLIGPPHSRQVAGPWPWMECLTSTSWPQLAQT